MASSVLVAMNAFKGTLSAAEACSAVCEGLQSAKPGLQCASVPLADGGRGTMDAFLAARGGGKKAARVTGPLGEPEDAEWALLADGRTAVIEMASAAGLTLVPPERRNPLHTTTYGVGELIRAAVNAGCTKILVGLGDSATVDGGLGASQALGSQFFRRDGSEIMEPITAASLRQIARVEPAKRLDVSIEVLADVNNMLLGLEGAARIFGPQKGATPSIVEELEEGMRIAYTAVHDAIGTLVAYRPGAGAAGGLGAAAMGLWHAEMFSGADRVLEAAGFTKLLASASAVITGEGRFDSQSLRGKGPGRVIELAAKAGVPVWVIAGAVEPGIVHPQVREILTLDGSDSVIPQPQEAFARLRERARQLAASLSSSC